MVTAVFPTLKEGYKVALILDSYIPVLLWQSQSTVTHVYTWVAHGKLHVFRETVKNKQTMAASRLHSLSPVVINSI